MTGLADAAAGGPVERTQNGGGLDDPDGEIAVCPLMMGRTGVLTWKIACVDGPSTRLSVTRRQPGWKSIARCQEPTATSPA